MRFVVPVRTVHAGPNPKYFGFGRGVTWYNLLSDQCSGLNAITVPGTLRDSLVLLAVVLVECGRGFKPYVQSLEASLRHLSPLLTFVRFTS